MSILRAALHVEQALDWGQPEEIRAATLAMLEAARMRWTCAFCGAERTEPSCPLCQERMVKKEKR